MFNKGKNLDNKRKNALEIIREWQEVLEKQSSDSKTRNKKINKLNNRNRVSKDE
ncbi:hypothetical protein AADC60_08100 [Cytobacillus pseudoceanisediminis]|uniref:Fur-regulated basic protein B n=1 Tax=Cytobacillus pseudoceanisediminis TaxID=3051614 RepID=A0ABZ2ZNU5_9BACI